MLNWLRNSLYPESPSTINSNNTSKINKALGTDNKTQKSFRLKHTVKNVSRIREVEEYITDIEKHHKIRWRLLIKRKNGFFGLFLRCEKQLSNQRTWAIKVDYQLRLVSLNRQSLYFSSSVIFQEPDNYGWPKFLSWDDMEEKYAVNDSIVIEARVKIISFTVSPCTGNLNRKIFTMKHTLRNISSIKNSGLYFTDTEKHYKVPWRLEIERSDGFLYISLVCCKNVSQDQKWAIDADFDFALVSTNGQQLKYLSGTVFEKREKCCIKLIKWNDMLERFAVNDSIIVEARVEILKMSGFDNEVIRKIADPVSKVSTTSTTRKLQYPCLSAVLKFIDANKRLMLARQCPTIRTLDRTIPLHLHKLKLLPARITLNNYEYRVGTIIHRTDGKPLTAYFSKKNREGGVQYSLTEQYADRWDPDDISPGDWKIPEVDPRNDRHRVDFPYKRYIQFTILDKMNGKAVHIERLEHGSRVHLAVKYLTAKLLGDRKFTTINVDTLILRCLGGILRLPELLKLRIRNLITTFNLRPILEVLEPLLDARSLPLKSMEVYIDSENILITSNVIETAEILILKDCWHISVEDLLALKNKTIRIYYYHMAYDEYLRMANDWIEKRREYGTCFQWVLTLESSVERYFKFFMSQSSAIAVNIWDTGCAEFPHDVLFQTNGSDSSFGVRVGCTKDLSTWTVSMEIVNPNFYRVK